MFGRTTLRSNNSTQRRRAKITLLLLVSLWFQMVMPPVLVASPRPSPIVAAVSEAPGRVMATLALAEHRLSAFLRAIFTPQENWNVILTPVTTEFKDFSGLDYHASSRKLLFSANTPGGMPNNFDAANRRFSNATKSRLTPRALPMHS